YCSPSKAHDRRERGGLHLLGVVERSVKLKSLTDQADPGSAVEMAVSPLEQSPEVGSRPCVADVVVRLIPGTEAARQKQARPNRKDLFESEMDLVGVIDSIAARLVRREIRKNVGEGSCQVGVAGPDQVQSDGGRLGREI